MEKEPLTGIEKESAREKVGVESREKRSTAEIRGKTNKNFNPQKRGNTNIATTKVKKLFSSRAITKSKEKKKNTESDCHWSKQQAPAMSSNGKKGEESDDETLDYLLAITATRKTQKRKTNKRGRRKKSAGGSKNSGAGGSSSQKKPRRDTPRKTPCGKYYEFQMVGKPTGQLADDINTELTEKGQDVWKQIYAKTKAKGSANWLLDQKELLRFIENNCIGKYKAVPVPHALNFIHGIGRAIQDLKVCLKLFSDMNNLKISDSDKGKNDHLYLQSRTKTFQKAVLGIITMQAIVNARVCDTTIRVRRKATAEDYPLKYQGNFGLPITPESTTKIRFIKDLVGREKDIAHATLGILFEVQRVLCLLYEENGVPPPLNGKLPGEKDQENEDNKDNESKRKSEWACNDKLPGIPKTLGHVINKFNVATHVKDKTNKYFQKPTKNGLEAKMDLGMSVEPVSEELGWCKHPT